MKFGANQLNKPTPKKVQRAGDAMQFPLIILGVTQIEFGRNILGYILIGLGVAFQIITRFFGK